MDYLSSIFIRSQHNSPTSIHKMYAMNRNDVWRKEEQILLKYLHSSFIDSPEKLNNVGIKYLSEQATATDTRPPRTTTYL